MTYPNPHISDVSRGNTQIIILTISGMFGINRYIKIQLMRRSFEAYISDITIHSSMCVNFVTQDTGVLQKEGGEND
jgi:hypothetical protein